MAPKQKPGKSKQDYVTPWVFINAVKQLLAIEEFDIDLSASAENTRVPGCYYTKQDNALVQPWKIGDGWNWLNPEFSLIGPWVGRAFDQAVTSHARTAVLVPAGVGSNWWRDFVHEKADVHFLNGRITFDGCPPNPKTGKVDPYPKDCALLLYSHDAYAVRGSYNVWTWHE